MNEPHIELFETAETMDQLVERSRQSNVQEPLASLKTVVMEIGKAWSDSWLGNHAHVYYKGLKPRPPGAHYNQDPGFRSSFQKGTTGEWQEFDPAVVGATIHDRAGNPNLEALEALR